jgi:superfamily II DNA or RNA helicase
VSATSRSIERLVFRGRWRRYQTLALDAFDRDVERGRRRTHIVAPPGSGKTLIGVEIIRRLGQPALVLVPNTAVQSQWIAGVRTFLDADDEPVAAAAVSAPIAVLTYQALCQLDDPAVVLGDVAVRRWTAERAEATGQTVAEVNAEVTAWTGEAAARRDRELRRISASLKREIARAEHGALHLGDLLSQSARARIDELHEKGLGTIVLDECHHLASLWGYVVRAVIEELEDAHLVGMTATPPDGLTSEEAELYEHLLGPVDFTVPTPAVVRERFLAPYQELAWFTRPLDSEAQWLAEHDLRFRELTTTLHDDEPGPLSFPAWVITRLRDRGREGEDAGVSWSSFQRRHPALARAGARFLASAGLELPEGAPRGEGYSEEPSLDDWLVLLEDYVLRCLRPDPSPAAAARYDAVAAALRELGFDLTRQGVRRGASDVDRLLTRSAAKSIALVDVVNCEYEARSETVRALVLTDTERARATPDGALLGVLRPEAGTAPDAVRVLSEDIRTAPLRPLLVSGRGLRCATHDADVLLAALVERTPPDVVDLRAEAERGGLVRLVGSGSGWQPRVWVALATEIFAAGVTKALVGTRALLGEGWDAPCVNCLVDLSAATTSVSVTQMRGRSLRLDPADPDKIASNWDIVAIAPELVRGDADYERFVRKHLHLFAPSEDGVIEAGPSHVHPSLSPFAPPSARLFDEINREMVRRAREHELARERWAIGEPYLAEEQQTLVVRPRRSEHERPSPRIAPPTYPVSQRVPYTLAGLATAVSPLLALAVGQPSPLAGLAAVPAALAWAYARLARTRRELQETLPLDYAAYAIRDAYRELGELSENGAGSLAIEPRSSGYLRVWLKGANPDEGARFTNALDDVVDPAGFPRYVVARLVPGRRTVLAALLRALTFRPPFESRWAPVPEDLGRRKERAEVFASAWQRWLGPSKLVFTQRTAEGKEALAAVGAQSSEYEARTRRIWQ